MRNCKLLKTMVLGALACGLSLSTGVAVDPAGVAPARDVGGKGVPLLLGGKQLGMIWLRPIG